jgi:hypothetical protein
MLSMAGFDGHLDQPIQEREVALLKGRFSGVLRDES